MLSQRASDIVPDLNTPWRFAPRATYSAAHPEGLISSATAENTLVVQHLEAFTDNISFPPGIYEYRFSTGGGTLPSHLARHVNDHFKPFQPVNTEEVQITASATAAHDLIAWAIGDPGDAILLCKPIYGRLEVDFGNKAGIKVVYADTTIHGLFEPSVVQKCEKALRKEVRALFVVNPPNPTGRCYPPETLVALMRFCNKHRIHFISDEVYAYSVHGSSALPRSTSALAIDTTDLIDPELLHVVYGLSKDFAAPGLRIGSIITRSDALRKAARSGERFMNPSGLSVCCRLGYAIRHPMVQVIHSQFAQHHQPGISTRHNAVNKHGYTVSRGQRWVLHHDRFVSFHRQQRSGRKYSIGTETSRPWRVSASERRACAKRLISAGIPKTPESWTKDCAE